MGFFNAKKESDKCVFWIKNWFENESGGAKGIVIGVSGGKDSTIATKLCVKAIGREKVFGVIMPNGEQNDLNDAISVCETIGIDYRIANIGYICNAIDKLCSKSNGSISDESKINIAPRIRMTILYAIGQTLGYRVCGTENACEKFVGYTTKWGDSACDFNPLANFKVSEVIAIGDELGLPYELVHKTPADGLTSMSDEEKLGVTYAEIEEAMEFSGYSVLALARYDNLKKVHTLNGKAQHKINPIPCYNKEANYD